MRVIGEDGSPLGVLSRDAALKKAEELEIDLIEIAPEAQPPVVKLIDFKKFKYLEDKKEREARKKAKQTELKEVRFTPFIGDHDLQTNLRKVKEFLAIGDIVKISIVFKGRQMAHQEFGPKLLERLMTELDNQVTQERPARMEGRRYVTVIRGIKGAFVKEERKKPADTKVLAGKEDIGKEEANKEKPKVTAKAENEKANENETKN